MVPIVLTTIGEEKGFVTFHVSKNVSLNMLSSQTFIVLKLGHSGTLTDLEIHGIMGYLPT